MYGMTGKSHRQIRDFLVNRSQDVVVNESKFECMVVTLGVPLGTVLGPLLFPIYIDDIECYLFVYFLLYLYLLYYYYIYYLYYLSYFFHFQYSFSFVCINVLLYIYVRIYEYISSKKICMFDLCN